MAERDVLAATQLALSRLRWRGRRACVVYRRTVGLFVTQWGQPIRIGLEGQADLYGYLATGRGLEIECKSPTGKLRAAQLNWKAVCEEMNVLWVLARTPECAAAAVLEALENGTATPIMRIQMEEE